MSDKTNVYDLTQGKPTGSPDPRVPTRLKVMSWRRRERALKVYEMSQSGFKVIEIARYFGLSRQMIWRDLRAAKALLRETLQDSDPVTLLAEEINFWRRLCWQALRDYQLSRNESARIGFLRVAIEARAKLQRLYQDAGLIATLPARINLVEANPFRDRDFRLHFLAFLKEARTKGVQIAGL